MKTGKAEGRGWYKTGNDKIPMKKRNFGSYPKDCQNNSILSIYKNGEYVNCEDFMTV